jgi:hypothetical protein
MSAKTWFILTGAAAWLGGVATAMTAASCDVETCETDPQPSAVVRFHTQSGSAWVPVRADSVRFQVHPTGGDPQTDLATPPATEDGSCLDDGCTKWTVGKDQPGRVQIWADVCGRSYSAEVNVEMDELACHTATEYLDIEVDDRTCPMDAERIPEWECEGPAHPSVHVLVAKRFDDYYAAVDVDMVWFEHDGKTYEARCLQNGQSCSAWIAGYEIEGPITVSTEHCETVVSKTVEVEPIPNSCHVQTEYVMLEVSTRGCLTGLDQQEPPPPPRPEWPWDLTTGATGDASGERPQLGSTDLTNRTPVRRPASPATDLTTPHDFPPPRPLPDDYASPQ